MTPRHYIACDLGAESGRVIVGTLADERLTLDEIHRFPNGPVSVNGSLRWDMLRMFDEVKTGLRGVARRGIRPESVSCDSWGVDYVLLAGDEPFLTAPFHYRDSRTDGGIDRTTAILPARELYAETGIQPLAINTLVQLHADLSQRGDILASADRFLHIGDAFNFLLSGVARQEESLASTSQLYSPARRKWSDLLIDRFGFPSHIFPEIVPSGTVLGPLRTAIAKETGLTPVSVIAGCSHDTAAAVAAIPAEANHWAYLSSGTWSLLGIESDRPFLDHKSMAFGFTNEVGFGGTIRFLKNIPGMWILQECRREWALTGREYSYNELMERAEKEPPARVYIDPADPIFEKPDHMPEKVTEACRRSGGSVPDGAGAIVRCVLESLSKTYAETVVHLEEATGRPIRTLHVVGGGSRNRFLNQLTADATNRTVLAGPVECSTAGNVLVQALALGHLGSIAACRDIVRRSFPIETFRPGPQRVDRDSRSRSAASPLQYE